MEIHHIDGNRENNVLPNLIALCRVHHGDAEDGIIDSQSLQQYKEINRAISGLEKRRNLALPEVTYENALRVVKNRIGCLDPKQDPISAEDVTATIKRSIYYGQAFYNRGQVLDCARVYQHTVVDLLAKIDEALTHHPDETSRYIGLISAELRPEIRDARRIQADEADEIAWALRRAFDRALMISSLDEGVREITELAKQAIVSQRVTMHWIYEMVSTAEMRTQGMTRHQSFVSAAHLSLATARAILGLSALLDQSEYSYPRRWLSTRLKPSIEAIGEVDAENAQSIYETTIGLLSHFTDHYCMYY